MRPRSWILLTLYTAIALAASLAVLLIGWASDFPLKQQPVTIGTMIVSVVLPFGFVATKRFIDERYPKSDERNRARPIRAAAGTAVIEVEPMHAPTATAAALDLPLRGTRTFEFNREKFLYFGTIAMSLCCVGNCVAGLFDPNIRSEIAGSAEGPVVSLWVWVLMTNLAIVAAAFFISFSVAGAVAPGYYLQLKAEGLKVGRWRRHVDLPWTAVRQLRIEHEWLIATVDQPSELPARAHAINGMQGRDIRRKLGPGDVALAHMRSLNGYNRTGERFILSLGWFWGRSKAEGVRSEPHSGNPDSAEPASSAPDR